VQSLSAHLKTYLLFRDSFFFGKILIKLSLLLFQSRNLSSLVFQGNIGVFKLTQVPQHIINLYTGCHHFLPLPIQPKSIISNGIWPVQNYAA